MQQQLIIYFRNFNTSIFCGNINEHVQVLVHIFVKLLQ